MPTTRPLSHWSSIRTPLPFMPVQQKLLPKSASDFQEYST
jgi:hypothetical protein